MSATKSSVKQLELLLKSGYKLIAFCSQEEVRAEEELKKVAAGHEGYRPRDYYGWTETEGLVTRDGKAGDTNKKTADPISALQWIIEREKEPDQREKPSLYVFKDLHPFINPRSGRSMIARKIKDTIRMLVPTRSAIVLLSGPHLEIPPELEKDIVILDFDLPNFDELREKLVDLIREYKGHKNVTIDLSDDDVSALAKAAQGLTMAEADLAYCKALVSDNRLDASDIGMIIEEKKQIIRKTGILTVEEASDIKEVGGLENLKSWLEKRRDILTERARRYGIPEPKGIMLTGIPGCGKSLCAKAIAKFWNIPLLRLDMGAVFQGVVGSSEANIRKAIKCAEAMAPCVLMIDEIEKGLAGAGGGESDGGTSSRVFGTLLSWMNDKTSPVFVVATANQFDRLPPEMLRKGRFDEIFFVDFPSPEERESIFKIHIVKRKREVQKFDVSRLVEKTQDFTGSEIEQAVVSGMIEAFADGGKEFNTEHVLAGIAKTIPMIDTMRDKIASIRQRAMECTVSASKSSKAGSNGGVDPSPVLPSKGKDVVAPERGGRQLDL